MPTTTNIRPRPPTPTEETRRRWSDTCRFIDACGGCRWDFPKDTLLCSPNIPADNEVVDWRGRLRLLHAQRGAVDRDDEEMGVAGRQFVPDPRPGRRWLPAGGLMDVPIDHPLLMTELDDLHAARAVLELCRWIGLARARPVQVDLDGSFNWKAVYTASVPAGPLGSFKDRWTLMRRSYGQDEFEGAYRPADQMLVEPPAHATDAELFAVYEDRRLLRRIRRAGERGPRDQTTVRPADFDSELARDQRNWGALLGEMEEHLVLLYRAGSEPAKQADPK